MMDEIERLTVTRIKEVDAGVEEMGVTIFSAQPLMQEHASPSSCRHSAQPQSRVRSCRE